MNKLEDIIFSGFSPNQILEKKILQEKTHNW